MLCALYGMRAGVENVEEERRKIYSFLFFYTLYSVSEIREKLS